MVVILVARRRMIVQRAVGFEPPMRQAAKDGSILGSAFA
jgi:hypothetical protein